MERKDYLVEELSKEEKLYLKRIVMTAKNKYFERNYNYINNTSMFVDGIVSAVEESVLDAVFEKCQEEVKSARESPMFHVKHRGFLRSRTAGNALCLGTELIPCRGVDSTRDR